MPTTYNSVSLAWSAPVEGTTGQYPASQLSYQIWRSLALGGPYTDIATTAVPGVTTYTDSTVAPSTTYYYYTVAIDPTGEVGLPSNTISVTTPPAPPVLAYAGPTPSFAQGNSGSVAPGGSSLTITAKYNKAQTAGNTNVVIVWPGSALGTPPVQDTAGNAYQPLPGFTPQAMPGQSAIVNIFVCTTTNQPAGANTVTANLIAPLSANSYGEMAILEYTSLTASPFDAFTTAGDSSGNTAGGGSSITPVNATDLLISFFICDINFASINTTPALCGPVTPPPGWNLETTASTNPSTSFGTSFTSDLQVYSLGTYTPVWSQNVTNPNPGYAQNPWAMFSLALKSTLSAPPPASSVPLSWTESDQTATGYNLYRGAVNGGPYPTKTTLGNVLSTNVTGLTGGTYYFVLTSVSPAGESANSNQITGVVASGSIPINASVLIR